MDVGTHALYGKCPVIRRMSLDEFMARGNSLPTGADLPIEVQIDVAVYQGDWDEAKRLMGLADTRSTEV